MCAGFASMAALANKGESMIVPMEKVCAAGVCSVPFFCPPLVDHVIVTVEIPEGVDIVHPPILRRKMKLGAVGLLVSCGLVVSGKWRGAVDLGKNKAPTP